MAAHLMESPPNTSLPWPVSQPALLAHYWEARPCEVRDAAVTLQLALQALRDAGFSTFFTKGRSRRSTGEPLIPSEQVLSAALAKGMNRRDIDASPITELGLSLGLWSGGPEPEAFEINVLIGSTSPHAKNCFLLHLPTSGPYALQREFDRLKALFHRLAVVLHSDQGIVCAPNEVAWEGRLLAAAIPSLARWKSQG